MFVNSVKLKAFVVMSWADYPSVRDRYAALFSENPAGAARAAARAWETRDGKVLTACIEVLAAAGALTAPLSLQGAIALLANQRPAEALDLLSRPEITASIGPKAIYHKARALAALGRFEDALSAAREALCLNAEFESCKELAQVLAKVVDLEALGVGTEDWTIFVRLMTWYVWLTAVDAQASLFRRALAAGPPREAHLYEHVFAVLDAGLAVAPEQAAFGRFLDEIPPALTLNRFVIALRASRDILGGRAACAELCAAAAADGGAEPLQAVALAHEAAGQPEIAALLLGQIARDRPQAELLVRADLARCVGAAVLATVSPRFRSGRPGKVFNVLPFNDELTLLQIHLHEMADWVDAFVIVEATQTFTGEPKPLHFQRHRADFAMFADKIIHLPLDSFPPYVVTPWGRDFYQRDIAVAALNGLWAEDDLVFITDTDEIVDRHAVQAFDGDHACLRMPLSRFFLNHRPVHRRLRDGQTGAVFKARLLGEHGLSYARFNLSRQHKNGPRIMDAGWHFSSIGPAETITAKFAGYAHQELAASAGCDVDAMGALLRRIRHGKLERHWAVCDIDDSFPTYVRRNQDSLSSIIA